MPLDVLYLNLPAQLDLLSQVLKELTFWLLDLWHIHDISSLRNLLLAAEVVLVIVWVLIVRVIVFVTLAPLGAPLVLVMGTATLA